MPQATLPIAPGFPANVLTLDNGLTLIHQEVTTVPVVVVDVWVRAGAITEPAGWPGVAHFLEHMIFKGTKRVAPGVFDQVVEHRGGMSNAATSHDYAHFYLATAAPYVRDTLPFLAEILLQAAIPDEDFGYEREVVLEEIRGSEDDPDWMGFQALCALLYPDHGYGRSVLGSSAQILQQTANQLRCFHRTYYQPENMTVVMVGSIGEGAAIAYTQESFDPFAVRSECPPVPLHRWDPLTQVKRQTLTFPNLGPSRLMMGWAGPGIEGLEDNVGLDLLAVILGGSQCARLVQHLREELGLVFDIQSCFSLQKDSSVLTLTAYLNGDQGEAVEQAIRQAIHQLHTTPVSPGELARAQRLLCNDYIFSTETPAQLAGLYGYYQTLAQAHWAIAYPQLVRQWTPLGLQGLAQRYLTLDNYALVLVAAAP